MHNKTDDELFGEMPSPITHKDIIDAFSLSKNIERMQQYLKEKHNAGQKRVIEQQDIIKGSEDIYPKETLD